MAVLFNFIPGSGLVAPGVFFERNSEGRYASVSWTLVLGHKSSEGVAQDNVPTVCTTIREAGRLAGNGSQLYELFRKVRRTAPASIIYVAPVPATGSPAAWTVTIGTLDSGGGQATLEIAGRYVNLAVAAGESAATTATNLAAAINSYINPLTLEYLPVTATAATNVVTLTARHAGSTMNEIEVFADGNIPGNLFTSSTVTIAQTVSAAGTADISAALANLGDDPFHWIVSPFSETANLNAAKTALSDISGRWNYLQQNYGAYLTVKTDTISGLITLGDSYKTDDHISIFGRVAAPTPSWEMLGGLVGRVVPWLSDSVNGNAARNQTGLAGDGIRPPRDRTSWFDYATRNALSQSGISTWAVEGGGEVVIDKIVTTRTENSAGQPDTTFRDIQAIAVTTHTLLYLKANLATRHANKAVADSNPGNIPTISTPLDIKADAIGLYGELVDRGLLENKEEFARNLVVERDAENRSRVNIGANAIDVVNPLDIIAVNATFRS